MTLVFKKFRPKLTRGKTGTKHAGTLLANIGPGSVPTKLIIIESEAGARVEAVFALQDQAFSDETCRSGDLIKFINIHIGGAARTAVTDEIGWVEWAVVWKREGESDLANTQLGTLTLGTVATNRYRNDCLFTGTVPLNRNSASFQEVSLKMPRSKQFLKVGEECVLFVAYRSSNSADVTTDDVRVVLSYNYKAYS